MSKVQEISVELLRELIDYCPETGIMTWKKRKPSMFGGDDQPRDHSCKIWNSRNAGRPALNSNNGNGYKHGAIFGKTVSSHKAAWAIFNGYWPLHGIDHINGDRKDNRICNLRDVPVQINSRNQKQNIRNTSGRTGVHLHRKTMMWVASIKGNGKVINLGYYRTIEEAAAVRKEAERRFGFHPNHGRKVA